MYGDVILAPARRLKVASVVCVRHSNHFRLRILKRRKTYGATLPTYCVNQHSSDTVLRGPPAMGMTQKALVCKGRHLALLNGLC
jgi:hypothetical protein